VKKHEVLFAATTLETEVTGPGKSAAKPRQIRENPMVGAKFAIGFIETL
jgi:hypothetical protein